MKKTFDQTKKETAKISANAFGIRSIAILMFFVMLFTAIGSGSVLSALAVTRGDEGADDSIAESVEVSEDFASSADLYDTEEALLGRKSDSDLAATGAKADLANVGANAEFAKTGDTTYYLWLAKNGGGNVASNYSNNGAMTANGDGTYTASFTISNNSNFAFCVCTSNSDKTSGFVTFPTTSVSVSSDLNSVQYQYLTINNTQYSFLQTNFKNNSSDTTVYVTCNPTSTTMSVSTTAPSGGSGSFDTYTVAGNNTDILGSSWDTTATANDMLTEDGVTYTKTYTISSVPNSQFEFKVVKDHAWGTEYPGSNFVVKFDKEDSTKSRSSSDTGTEFYVSDGDEMTITFSNDSNHTITVSFVTPETTHNVTFSADTGGTISPSGTVAVGESTATTVTATANPGYEFTGWNIGDGITVASGTATGASPSTTLSVKTESSGEYTVHASFTKKPVYAITMSTNSSSYGTTASSVAYAYAGQTVTVTATEKDGTFSNWSVLSGGATLTSTSSASTTFTMPANAVAIKGNFNEYRGTSEWYYNGYTTSGMMDTSDDDGYAQPMTEAKVDGNTYSFYEVNDRSGSNQLFTVSYKSPAHTYGEFDYIYFHGGTDDSTDTNWSKNNDIGCWFESSDGKTIKEYAIMEYAGWSDGYKMWRAHVPYGAKYINFKDDHKTCTWEDIDLSSGYRSNMCYWTNSSGSNGSYNIAGYTNPVPDGFNEYFYNMNSVYLNTTDHSFGDYNVSFGGASHTLANPSNAPTGESDTYYVLVLYPGKTYTINGDTVSVPSGSTPYVVYTGELPTTEDPNAVKIYAKDGALRNDSARYTFASIADTKIYDAGGNAVGTSVSYANNQSYETYSAMKGETITIKTIISDDTATGISGKYNELFYVVGFCVNGKVPDGTLNKKGISGGKAVDGGTEYTLTYEIDEDFAGNMKGENIIEITPIYYLADTSTYKCVTFYVEGFDGAGTPTNWGDTLFVYPFYGSLSNYSNAFGSYPGQPMVYYGGQYYIQIPLTDTSPFANDSADSAVSYATRLATNVSGVTLHNGYYDTLHNKLMGYLSNQDTYQTQTYDFDNFYKIYNENSDVNHILFEFRYRTANDNKSDLGSFGTTNINVSDFTTTFTNEFEDLKNYHGKQIDLFGTALSGSLLQRNPIYVVSEAGPTTNNIAGRFATQWHIYVPSSETGTATYSKFTNGSVTSIPSSLLVLKDEDSFDNTKYPSAGNGSTTDWEAYYTALKAAWKDYPVKITFEKAKGGDSDAATRSDGLWKYATDGENITSTIRVDYSDDNGTTWVTNPDNTADDDYISGLEAYFTNSGVSGTRTYATTVDGDKTFDYKAQSTNGSYKFVGWYFDNGSQITSNASGSTSRTRSFTFVARFMKVTSGQLTLSHSTATGAVGGVTYNGSGTALISVSVTDCDSGDTVYSKENESSITLDSTYIASNKDYDITVTLTSTASANSTLGTTVLTNPSGEEAKYFANQTPTTVEKTNTYSFTFNVKEDLFNNTTEQETLSLIYQSYFGLPTFNYKFKFEAKMRDGSTKNYYREGTLTTDEVEDYVTSVYDSSREMTVKYLAKAFVEKLAPHESNFNIDYTWNIADTYAFTGPDNYVYNISSTAVTCRANQDLGRTATFSLPYAHTNGVATVNDGTVNKATAKNFVIDNLTYTQLIKNGEEYVQAPSTIYDAETGKTLYFQYWSVASTKDSATEIARCYYYKFNLVAYDNYIITPVYTDTVSTGIKDSGAFTNITYLDTSRNQWNTDGENHAKTDRENAADLLYNDFVLNYNYNGTEIYLDQADSADVTELGIVIERVETLAIKGDGSPDTTLSRYAGHGVSTDTIEDVINGSTETGISKHAIAKTALDNKNRIELYEAYYNSAGWSKADQKPMAKYGYKNYVYKAYTYMIVKGNIVLCETPAYFTMYDEAVL